MITSLDDVRYILEHPESEDYAVKLIAAQSFLSGIPGPTALMLSLEITEAIVSAQIAAQEVEEDDNSFQATRFGQTIFPDDSLPTTTQPESPFASIVHDKHGPLPERQEYGTVVILGEKPRMAEDILPED